MAKIPKMVVQIGADLSGLRKGTRDAGKELGGFRSRINALGKSIAQGFAVAATAVAAFAVKLSVDGVQAAMADVKAQRLLATQLKKTTKATDQQVASVEEWVKQTSLAYGVADDKLRPALARLIRSTKDANKAQQLLSTAMDISVATGKSLDTVTAALGKAYDGNNASLSRLGLGIDSSILKGEDFNVVWDKLRKNFSGFADDEANTTEGKIRKLGVAWDEIQESIGMALLPALESVSDWFTDEGMKGIETFFDVLMGKDPKSGEDIFLASGKHFNTLRDDELSPTQKSFADLAESVKDMGTAFGEFFKELAPNDPNSDLNKTIDALETLVSVIGSLVDLTSTVNTESVQPWFNGDVFDIEFWKRQWEHRPGQDWNPNSPSSTGNSSQSFRPSAGGTTIIVNGALDPLATARAVARAQAQANRMGGTTGAGMGVG